MGKRRSEILKELDKSYVELLDHNTLFQAQRKLYYNAIQVFERPRDENQRNQAHVAILEARRRMQDARAYVESNLARHRAALKEFERYVHDKQSKDKKKFVDSLPRPLRDLVIKAKGRKPKVPGPEFKGWKNEWDSSWDERSCEEALKFIEWARVMIGRFEQEFES